MLRGFTCLTVERVRCPLTDRNLLLICATTAWVAWLTSCAFNRRPHGVEGDGDEAGSLGVVWRGPLLLRPSVGCAEPRTETGRGTVQD